MRVGCFRGLRFCPCRSLWGTRYSVHGVALLSRWFARPAAWRLRLPLLQRGLDATLAAISAPTAMPERAINRRTKPTCSWTQHSTRLALVPDQFRNVSGRQELGIV